MFKLNLSDLREIFSIGDRIELVKPAKTGNNRFKQGEQFEVLGVTESVVDFINDKDYLLTLHRFIIDEYAKRL